MSEDEQDDEEEDSDDGDSDDGYDDDYFCEDPLVHCIGLCCRKMISGKIPLTKMEIKFLKRRKNDIKKLASDKVTRREKRAILQKGGFLGGLLAPIVSILGSIFSQ